MWYILMLSKDPPLGKTAAELALSRGLFKMARMLEGAAGKSDGIMNN
jgi:hypothetical protein